MKWQQEGNSKQEEDRFVTIEKLLNKVNKRMALTAKESGDRKLDRNNSKESFMGAASGSRSSSEGDRSDDC